MSRLLIITCLGLWAMLGACDRAKKEAVVGKDTYVDFTSHLGNSFVAPSQWTATDEGDTFSLTSPDGQAIIHAMMFTAEGSGSIKDFRKTIEGGLLPGGATAWKASDWTSIKIGERDAEKRDLIPVPESHQQWRLYVLDNGRFYYAIVLNASNTAMTLNGGFYEKLVLTFKGVRE